MGLNNSDLIFIALMLVFIGTGIFFGIMLHFSDKRAKREHGWKEHIPEVCTDPSLLGYDPEDSGYSPEIRGKY